MNGAMMLNSYVGLPWVLLFTDKKSNDQINNQQSHLKKNNSRIYS